MNADERHAAADRAEQAKIDMATLASCPLYIPHHKPDPWEELMALILRYNGRFQIENDQMERFVRLDLSVFFRGQKLAVSNFVGAVDLQASRFGIAANVIEQMVYKIKQFIESFEGDDESD